MAERIIINTGPLIALTRMDALAVTGQLPYEFLCPREVQAEIEAGAVKGHPVALPSWLRVQPLQGPLSPIVLLALDLGEAAVIQLALEQQISLVCIDEWKGRRVALAAGLRVTGSLGLIGRAKVLGLVPTVRPLIDRALRSGIRYHPDLVRQIIDELGE
jgi:predicted nucleic acid-binding protein